MPYTADKRTTALPREILEQKIVGWGADLDPEKRPGVPREKFDPAATGAHWKFPERQPEIYPRERSPEHEFLTPVFGTTCPPRGISGAIRRYAYRFSEGRTAHWMLLVIADRVDVFENNVRDVMRGRIPNPIKEYGLASEIEGHGIRSRFGRGRADLKRLPVDVLFASGAAIAAVVGFMVLERRWKRFT
jgi:hypothetical protein